MITRDLWKLTHPDAPMAGNIGTRAQCEEWRDRRPIAGRLPESYQIEPYPYCTVCGTTWFPHAVGITSWSNGAMRCERHADRDACAIEGCERTRRKPEGRAPSDDGCLCGDHWRRLVPPRSRLRRIYHTHFRRAKKLGWDDRRARAYWRFWRLLLRIARKRAAEGHLDEAEINRLMGWG